MSEDKLQQMQLLLQKSLIKIKKLEQEVVLANENKTDKNINQDIAVVGYAFTFPNGINTIDKLWNLLYEKKDAVSKIPNTRFNVDEIYSTDVYENGKTNSPFGTFLEQDVSLFDADFFGIPPREAKSIDPIQRILLQLTYEAFENAGIATQQLKGKNIGVFVAVGLSDYAQARLRSGNLADIDVYDATGIPFATICGRISYSFDFNGQSIAVDTACSSVLSAVHQAQHALENREIDMAVIASANLLLTPEIFVALTKMGSVSPTGTTKAFAENADGYIRGEGAAILILKRKDDAIGNNDNIELLIKSSVIKHNGTSNGFTAPNPNVQISTIHEALKKANLTVDDIDFVESHGIGNKTTDAMEVQAIHQAFRNKKEKIAVGSVKANIGHLEACTGMPMLFKLMAAMQHQTIPAQIHIQELNQDIDWQHINVQIPREHQNWNKENKIAAINLSGYSGTNAHLIVQEAPKQNVSEIIDAPYIFNLSAKTENALKLLAQKYIQQPSIFEHYTLSEICYTLNQRNTFDCRLSIFATDKHDILHALKDYVEENANSKLFCTKKNINTTSICFQYAGQGSQYFGMCQKYYQTFEVFKHAFDACNTIYEKISNQNLKNIIWEDVTNAPKIHETQYTQVAIFCIEYALTKLLAHFKIQPTVLIGHSIGEIVALCVAETLSLEDAVKLVYTRATLMQNTPNNNGSMAAVFCNAGTIEQYNHDKIIEIAGYNTQNNTTITGTKENIEIFIDRLKIQNIKAVLLQVSHAFHSKQMDDIVALFQEKCNQISFALPKIPVISNVDGKVLEHVDALYLAQQLRVPVQYLQGINTIKQQYETNIFIECCSNPVLSALSKNILNDADNLYLYTAKHQTDDVQHFYSILQTLFCNGVNVNWNVLYDNKKINRVKLPNYAWQEKSYWYNPNRHETQESGFKSHELRIKNQQPITNNQATNTTNHHLKKEHLLVTMQIEAAKILGLEAGQMLDIQKPYREQGFDSMMSGEFLAKMENLIGAGEIKMDVIHNYPTPKDLHQYWIDTYFGGGIVDTSEAISMADLMFNADIDFVEDKDWHNIKPTDNALMRWFKKIDKKLPKVK
jgi:acyl transferase domain-containing protein